LQSRLIEYHEHEQYIRDHYNQSWLRILTNEVDTPKETILGGDPCGEGSPADEAIAQWSECDKEER
ncbi:MAG: hypothetical protein J6Y29_03755, partial [Clostridiales bacterium]|nr:hypothetical protein [Clostridiales bacterium]